MSVRASKFLSLVLRHVPRNRRAGDRLDPRPGPEMAEGHVFYCSANGVWLVDHVPPKFIDFKGA